jgi:hypothetical protein
LATILSSSSVASLISSASSVSALLSVPVSLWLLIMPIRLVRTLSSLGERPFEGIRATCVPSSGSRGATVALRGLPEGVVEAWLLERVAYVCGGGGELALLLKRDCAHGGSMSRGAFFCSCPVGGVLCIFVFSCTERGLVKVGIFMYGGMEFF